MKWNWAISEKRIFGITGHWHVLSEHYRTTSICYIGRNFASFFSFLYFFFSTDVLYCSPRKRSNRSRLYYLVSKGKTILKKTKGSLLFTGKRRTCLMNNLHRLCFRNVAEYKSCNTNRAIQIVQYKSCKT